MTPTSEFLTLRLNNCILLLQCSPICDIYIDIDVYISEVCMFQRCSLLLQCRCQQPSKETETCNSLDRELSRSLRSEQHREDLTVRIFALKAKHVLCAAEILWTYCVGEGLAPFLD